MRRRLTAILYKYIQYSTMFAFRPSLHPETPRLMNLDHRRDETIVFVIGVVAMIHLSGRTKYKEQIGYDMSILGRLLCFTVSTICTSTPGNDNVRVDALEHAIDIAELSILDFGERPIIWGRGFCHFELSVCWSSNVP
jgi:hypothetical protein